MNSPAVRARLAATKRTKQFIREFPAVVRAVVEKELPNLETSLAAMCGNPSVDLLCHVSPVYGATGGSVAVWHIAAPDRTLPEERIHRRY